MWHYRIKRVPFVIWYGRHELVHVLVGLMYAWVLRELWGMFSFRYVILAAIGSVIIDADHVAYFFFYGRHEWYAKEVRKFLRAGQIGTLTHFLTSNHKRNTDLLTHNVYVLVFFLSLSLVSFYHDWKAQVVLFGAIVIHLIMDVIDDFWVMGYLNDNWKRLRRKKRTVPQPNS